MIATEREASAQAGSSCAWTWRGVTVSTGSASASPLRDHGLGTSAAALDLVAELDQGQLATGHLFGQAAALLRVLDLHQLVGVGQAVLAQRHELADLGRRVGQPKAILEVALVLAELVGELADAVAVLMDHPIEHRGFVERREVLALEVLDDRDLQGRVVVDVLDQGRDRRQSGLPGGPPATLAGNDLVRVRAERPDQDRLKHAVFPDRRRQLIERRLLEDEPWLLGVRLDPLDMDDADADRPGRAVG